MTIGFNQVEMNGTKKYMLLRIPSEKTAIGVIELTAPKEVGLYEVIALAVNNPFEKINRETNFGLKPIISA